MKTEKQMSPAVDEFAEQWKGKGYPPITTVHENPLTIS